MLRAAGRISFTSYRGVAITYDALGNLNVIHHNGGASTGAAKNPFTYRGYYYDRDICFYYLQSRYYDPLVGRFINADSYVSTGQGLIGNNMFAYCGNNPVAHIDNNGKYWFLFVSFLFGFITGKATANRIENDQIEKKIAPKLQDTYTEEEAKDIVDGILSKYEEEGCDLELKYEETAFTITNSYKVTSRYDRLYICSILERTGKTNRNKHDLSAEWYGHNIVARVTNGSFGNANDVSLEYCGDPRLIVWLGTDLFELLGWE